MPFPNSAGKHAGRPFVTPARLLEYRARQDVAAGTPPPGVVLTWQASLAEQVRERRAGREIPGPAGPLAVLASGLGFARLPIGAPVAAIVIEELAALGLQAVVGVGTAGAIGDGLAPGDLVVCSGALRDEGTSHHYAPPDRFALPDPGLTGRLRAQLPQAVPGPSWTTDAPYRETAEEITAYRAEGILTVEMEAAALFTVARHIGLAAAAVFCVSDVLHGEQWEPHFHAAGVQQGLWTLFEAAEACLVASLPPDSRPAVPGNAVGLPASRPLLALLAGMLDGRVRAWEHQAGVTVVETHHVGRLSARSMDLDDFACPLRLAHDVAVHVEPVSDGCLHRLTSSLVPRMTRLPRATSLWPVSAP
jgi:uridine phosphorylase